MRGKGELVWHKYLPWASMAHRVSFTKRVRATCATDVSRSFVDDCVTTRAALEVHHFFRGFLNLRAQDLSQKLIRSQIKNWYRVKKSHGLGVTTRIMKKQIDLFPDDFGLRSPVIQKPLQTKNASYLYRCSTRLILYATYATGVTIP